MEVFDPEQAEQELEEELRDVDNHWIVRGSSAANKAPRPVVPNTNNASALPSEETSIIAAVHAAMALVDAAFQLGEVDASGARLHRDRWR